MSVKFGFDVRDGSRGVSVNGCYIGKLYQPQERFVIDRSAILSNVALTVEEIREIADELERITRE